MMILRNEKGIPLTHDEMDGNLEYLRSSMDSLATRTDDVETIALYANQIATISTLPEADSLDHEMEFSVRNPNPFPPIFQKVRLETLAQYIQNHDGSVSEDYVQNLYYDLATYADSGDGAILNEAKAYCDALFNFFSPDAHGVGSYILAALHSQWAGTISSLAIGDVIYAGTIIPGSILTVGHFRFKADYFGDPMEHERVHAFCPEYGYSLPGSWRVMKDTYIWPSSDDIYVDGYAYPSLFMRVV